MHPGVQGWSLSWASQSQGGCSSSLQISGFWREVGLASEFNMALDAGMKVEGLFITLSGRNMTVKAAYNNSGSCTTEKVVGSGRDAAVGKFAFPGHREIHVLDTDYEHYAILRVSLQWQGKEFHVFKYLTRSLDREDEPGFWRFRELTADTGLYLVSRHRRCAKLLKEVSPHPSVCTEDPSPGSAEP
ncbi:epididymal-specific lipocalin-8 isoform X3 [Marmota marmota marmota]|uniref:epididymal-specific lipocalin-8 isoform X3 n=1 Tax=Marmota marmota marmota TaxID=9994 RepID=UPI0020924C8C|nr:epididymal-specific lipocalin-8 isoform X3 [Marmota marmota marmota]